jgi:hypothetical protein
MIALFLLVLILSVVMKPDSRTNVEDAVAGRQPNSRTNVEDAVAAHTRWTPYLHHSSYDDCLLSYLFN